MLSSEAQAVFRAMSLDPSLGVVGIADECGLPESSVRRALDELADQSLLSAHSDPDAPAPQHPLVALTEVIAQAEADVATRQAEIAELGILLDSVRAARQAALARENLTIHTRVESIQARLEELSLGAASECVSFNPGRAHKPTDMAASKPLNQRALERGVSLRAIYQDSFRNDPGTLAYARWLTGLGGQVRTLPLVSQNLVLVDKEVALLPRTPGQPAEGAIEVHAPGIVAALADWFDAVWAVAEPFGGTPQPAPAAAAPQVTRQVLALLATGMTDEAAAHRLGLSGRTVRRIMAKAMDDLGAESRFQAGVEAVRHGWIAGAPRPAQRASLD